MTTLMLPIAAIGYSPVYVLIGGGFVGAILIFAVAKAPGKWPERLAGFWIRLAPVPFC